MFLLTLIASFFYVTWNKLLQNDLNTTKQASNWAEAASGQRDREKSDNSVFIRNVSQWVQSDEQPKPCCLTYSVYNNSFPFRLFLPFRSLFSCPSVLSKRLDHLLHCLRKCQLFNSRLFKELKCLQLTFQNSCLRQYLVLLSDLRSMG